VGADSLPQEQGGEKQQSWNASWVVEAGDYWVETEAIWVSKAMSGRMDWRSLVIFEESNILSLYT
jgi:hypothetical protein